MVRPARLRRSFEPARRNCRERGTAFHTVGAQGDAVFAYATTSDPVPRGAAMLTASPGATPIPVVVRHGSRQLDMRVRCLHADLRPRPQVHSHAGTYVIQEIAGKSKLAGPEVVMAHRLLKNNAATLVGHSAYAPITAAAAARLGIPTQVAVPIVETATRPADRAQSSRCGRPRRGRKDSLGLRCPGPGEVDYGLAAALP